MSETKSLIAIVHINADVLVRFPPGILRDEHISDEGALKDAKLAEAAKNAAIGFLSRSGEIDGAGDLDIPFCSKPNGCEGSSMIQ
ncbi:MAG: hypothetical protein WC789_09170, partial [Lentisphaeria bacterium]